MLEERGTKQKGCNSTLHQIQIEVKTAMTATVILNSGYFKFKAFEIKCSSSLMDTGKVAVLCTDKYKVDLFSA